MALDYVVHYPCEVKMFLGKGDLEYGTGALDSKIRAHHLSNEMAAFAHQNQLNPLTLSVTFRRVTPTGIEIQPFPFVELRAEAAGLLNFRTKCKSCPVNPSCQPFGCFRSMSYPIPAEIEHWLVSHLEPATTLGGKLFMQAIAWQVELAGIASEMRENGLFELEEPIEWEDPIGNEKVQFNSNFLMGLLFANNQPLTPMMSASILLWFGALKIDGDHPWHLDVKEVEELLLEMDTIESRKQRTALAIDFNQLSTPSLNFMSHWLTALYTGWVESVEVLISA
ncbi:MAG TPA: hypothetical protein PLB32_12050 [Acidobacteriota bacterium]|nr:hypothetical protein [Acidobacteriota bacterium]